jgi:hypothetical protein
MWCRVVAIGIAAPLAAAPALAQKPPEAKEGWEDAHERAEEEMRARKEVVLAVEYETALDPVAAQGSVFMVGGLLTYFFTW